MRQGLKRGSKEKNNFSFKHTKEAMTHDKGALKNKNFFKLRSTIIIKLENSDRFLELHARSVSGKGNHQLSFKMDFITPSNVTKGRGR